MTLLLGSGTSTQSQTALIVNRVAAGTRPVAAGRVTDRPRLTCQGGTRQMIDHDSLVPTPEASRREDWLLAYRHGLVDIPVCAENGVFSSRYEALLDT